MLFMRRNSDNNLHIYWSEYIQEFITYNLQIDDIFNSKITSDKTVNADSKWKS